MMECAMDSPRFLDSVHEMTSRVYLILKANICHSIPARDSRPYTKLHVKT